MGNSNRPRNPYYEEDPYTRSSQQQNAPRQRASSGYGYGSQQSEDSRTPSAPRQERRFPLRPDCDGHAGTHTRADAGTYAGANAHPHADADPDSAADSGTHA